MIATITNFLIYFVAMCDLFYLSFAAEALNIMTSHR